MKLTVLGSGIYFSGSERACSGYLVESGENAAVMDLGYGAFKRLQAVYRPEKINSLLFTHFHADHTLDLISFLFYRHAALNDGFISEKSQVNVLGPKGSKSFFEKAGKAFPFLGKLQFPLKIEEMDYGSKKIFGLEIKSKPLKHVEESIGYRIESKGKALAYSGDTDYCQEIVDLGKDADLLILECTCPDEKKVEAHLTPSECARIASEANAKKLLVSHYSHLVDPKKAAETISRKFKGEVLVAEDLMQIEV